MLADLRPAGVDGSRVERVLVRPLPFSFFWKLERERVAVARGGEAEAAGGEAGSGGCRRGELDEVGQRPVRLKHIAHAQPRAAHRSSKEKDNSLLPSSPPPLPKSSLKGVGTNQKKLIFFFHFENKTKKRRSSPTSPPTRTPSPGTSRPSFREASAWAPPP